jgi:aminoglycoside phosphotransferase (APT) family kinase protein
MTPHQFRVYDVSLDTARALCDAHGVAAPTRIRRVPKGEVSAVFLLELADGSGAVLKAYLRHQNPAALVTEHAVIGYLHRHSDLPVPAWTRLDLSRDVLAWPLALMECRPGVDADDLWPRLEPADAARLVRGCGRMLSALHRVGCHAAELSDSGLAPAENWAEREEHEFATAVRRLTDQGWLDPYLLERAQQVWDQGRSVRATPFAPVLMHGDYQLWNLRVDPHTLQPLGLLDWGQAALGPASADVRDMELNLFLDRPRLRREFWHGYGSGDPDERELERLRQAALCRALSLLAAYWGPTQSITPASVWHLLAPWSEQMDEG